MSYSLFEEVAGKKLEENEKQPSQGKAETINLFFNTRTRTWIADCEADQSIEAI